MINSEDLMAFFWNLKIDSKQIDFIVLAYNPKTKTLKINDFQGNVVV